MDSTSTFDSSKKSKSNKYNVIIFIFVIISFTVYQFFPLIYVNEDINLINEKIKEAEIDYKFKKILKERGLDKNDTIIKESSNFDVVQKNINIEKTFFIEYSYTITPYIYMNNTKVSPNIDSLNGSLEYELLGNPKDPKIIIRYDNMLIFYPILFITFFVIYVNNLPSINKLNEEITINNQQSILNPLEFELDKNINYSEKIMLELNSRSLFLLSFGIFMAFIGMGIFYITLPQTNSINDINSFILAIVKPLFILLFIEAIAWFLLKQYRNLMEDFKHFYKIYLKRSNYKLSYYLLKEIDDNSNKNKYETLINGLLSEDLSGKLYSGETTESLENKKMNDENIKKGLEQLLELLKNQKD